VCALSPATIVPRGPLHQSDVTRARTVARHASRIRHTLTAVLPCCRAAVLPCRLQCGGAACETPRGSVGAPGPLRSSRETSRCPGRGRRTGSREAARSPQPPARPWACPPAPGRCPGAPAAASTRSWATGRAEHRPVGRGRPGPRRGPPVLRRRRLTCSERRVGGNRPGPARSSSPSPAAAAPGPHGAGCRPRGSTCGSEPAGDQGPGHGSRGRRKGPPHRSVQRAPRRAAELVSERAHPGSTRRPSPRASGCSRRHR